MTLTLWGRTDSSNVMKVMWLLAETGIEYTRIDAGGKFGGTAAPEYRAMQPQGLVPALREDDGFTMFESNAILRYLGNTRPSAGAFYPQAPRPRGVVDAMLDLQQTALNRPQGTVFVTLVRTPPDKRDATVLARAVDEAAAIWAIAEGVLARRPYLAGEELSIADMAWGVHAHRWLSLPVPGRPDAPHLRAWYDRLMGRPAYATEIAKPIT